MKTIGLDIGSNSVGSSWIDTETKRVQVAVSVFPAGVSEAEDKRGAPKNQDRRGKRSLRRSLARRSARKRRLRRFLAEQALLPKDADELKELFALDPWGLRQRGLTETLTPPEFGRVLLHLCQRRGAMGLNLPEPEVDDEDGKAKEEKKAADESSDAKVKDAVERTREQLKVRNARTFGELIAIEVAARREQVKDKDGEPKLDKDGNPITYGKPVRNRLDSFEFHADRTMIREEFQALWEKQQSLGGPLAKMLTAQLRLALDDPDGDEVWRHKGLLFGQRRTYWDTGTLGRCDLEPTDRCVSIADRHASYYRVLESVNNIRIERLGEPAQPLSIQQRLKVIELLRGPLPMIKRKGELVRKKSITVPDIREALGLGKRRKNDPVSLNLEKDEERPPNDDWFHREVVLGAIGETTWDQWDERKREKLNRALLRFDPQVDDDAGRVEDFARKLCLDDEATARLVAVWQLRPKLEKRLKLSRRAIENLLPFMERAFTDLNRDKNNQTIQIYWLGECDFDPTRHRWLTQIEAREAFAKHHKETYEKTGDERADKDMEHRIRRYELGGNPLSSADRYFMKKHPDLLPPAPTMSNPVVRKAIHEVRRHVIAYIRHFGCKPDRIVIEFARETTKSAKVSDQILFRNRNRNRIRKQIIDEVVRPALGESNFNQLSNNQIRAAVDRVILCIQQRGVCAYSAGRLDGNDEGSCAYTGRPITLRQAALGHGLEVDHIIPYSRCGDNSLGNRVLCYREANRDKTNKTPRQWWGDKFEERVAPVRFMDGYEPDRRDYFTKRDYAAKWRNFSRTDVPKEWQGSQLTDTAYAAREVQTYLQQALWPDERSFLQGDANRRIFVTKGAYTAILRKDLRLYQTLISKDASPEEIKHAAAKNRGDHREHAVDAVAIALAPDCMQDLAAYAKLIDEERKKARAAGREPKKIKRTPIPPPWSNVDSFRHEVLCQLFDDIDPPRDRDPSKPKMERIVVCHRPVGKKLVGQLHDDNPLAPVPGQVDLFTKRLKVERLGWKHLRLPHPETEKQSIERITDQLLKDKVESTKARARKRARQIVQSPGFTPKHIDPPPEKGGIVRDLALRKVLRAEICKRIAEHNSLMEQRESREKWEKLRIKNDVDSFTDKDIQKLLKSGPLRMPSGVPIKRVILLRTMKDPVVVSRRKFDYQQEKWIRDTARAAGSTDRNERTRADRAYVGGNNHHLEIREDATGKWSGIIVPTFEAARRVRIEKREAVDRLDDDAKGGRFVMSLAEGETVYMLHKELKVPGYFVVFELKKEKKQAVFKAHWDARRDKGEKDDAGNVIPGTKREEFSASAAQLQELAPPGEATPIKVIVDPLGSPRRVEPVLPRDDTSEIDPRVMAIARDAIAARQDRDRTTDGKEKRRQLGSWNWMHERLRREKLEHLAPQLSQAMRLLKDQ